MHHMGNPLPLQVPSWRPARLTGHHAHQQVAALLLPLLLLLGLYSVQPAAATPQQFVSNIAREDCTRHPDRGYGQHGKPVPDGRASISLTPLPGSTASQPQAVTASQGTQAPSQAVTELCAGSNYTLTVSWTAGTPDATPSLGDAAWLSFVNALVTASSGTLAPERRTGLAAVAEAGEALGVLNLYSTECPNRYVTPVVTRAINLLLGVPQNQTGPLTIKVTSASGPFDEFKSFTATIPVQQCGTSSTEDIQANSASNVTAVTVQPPATINTTVSQRQVAPVTASDSVGQPIAVTTEDSALLQQIEAANGNSVIDLRHSSTSASVVNGSAAGAVTAVNSAGRLTSVTGQLLVCMVVLAYAGQLASMW